MDGAATGKEGYAAIGILIVEDGVQEQIGMPLEGRMDNHRADFEALLHGLRHLKAQNKQDQLIFNNHLPQRNNRLIPVHQ